MRRDPGPATLPRMSPEEFDAIVWDSVEQLPEWVREGFDNIELLIQDVPDADLDPDGEGLLGLYVGVPLTERSVEDVGGLPDIIYIFRHPHIGMGLPQAELRDEIRKTLIHEVAHFFGIDDDHLDDIGWG